MPSRYYLCLTPVLAHILATIGVVVVVVVVVVVGLVYPTVLPDIGRAQAAQCDTPCRNYDAYCVIVSGRACHIVLFFIWPSSGNTV